MSALLVRSLLAIACVAIPQCSIANSPSDPDVLTVFVHSASEVPANSMTAMREEVARLLEGSGLRVDWKSMSDRKPGEDYPRLVKVDLRGPCAAGPLVPGLAETRSLASTAVVDGRILPFASVDCDRLRRFMAPGFNSVRQDKWPELFGRAMGRVVAHEIFHMVVQTRHHAEKGVSKAGFSVNDLTSDKFQFDEFTLAQLRPTGPATAAIEQEDEAEPAR